MDEGLKAAYASVVLGGGLAIGAGDRLRIVGDFPHRELMYAIAGEAYCRGAALVRIEYDDRRLARLRADLSADAYLDDLHAVLERESEVFAAELWSSLRIVGDEDPEALSGADQDRLARIQRARSRSFEAMREAQMSSRVPWCVIPAATDAWARGVLGPGAAADDLWKVLVPILRLDKPDPSSEQRAQMAGLEERAKALDALSLRQLRFSGPGTELRVELAPESRWLGGPDRTPEGRVFMPNIPTEETFATPDFRGTEGYTALTRPVRLLGSIVEGGRLRFEGGVVVDASAEKGEKALLSYLETDPGSHRLGEVALVDSGSPIGRSGLVFDSALIDENAACHIALGSGYEGAFRGSEDWSDEEKGARGFNVSLVHEDLMIGSPELDVVGIDAAGREIPLMRKGGFARSVDSAH